MRFGTPTNNRDIRNSIYRQSRMTSEVNVINFGKCADTRMSVRAIDIFLIYHGINIVPHIPPSYVSS